MRTALIIILLLSGMAFTGSVLLMSPKGGLGMGVAGMGGGSEYGSKKSVETTLKKIAIATSIIFIVSVALLPYSS